MLFMVLLTFTSCDPCANTECENGGTCISGDCYCLDTECIGPKCEICPTEYTFLPEESFFICPTVVQGDYKLHDNKVVEADVSCKIYVENNNLVAEFIFEIRELGHDSTVAVVKEYKTLFIPDESMDLMGILSDERTSLTLTDPTTNIPAYFETFPDSELLKQVKVVVRTPDLDFGECDLSHVHLVPTFNPITLKLRKRI